MGVKDVLIRSNWKRLPKELQGHQYGFMKAHRVVPREKFMEHTGGQCDKCGLYFAEDNPRQQNGVCLLCRFHAEGRTITYAELVTDH
jgi:formylmethanofuran dehydrogenase subunit E